MTWTALLYFVAITAASQMAGPETLLELARRHGQIEVIVNNEYQPTTLGEVARGAEVIVEAVVVGAKSALASDERSVFTDYEIEVAGVIKGSRVGIGDRITVRRTGGTVRFDGLQITVREAGFTAFQAQQMYVLFLRATPVGNTYDVFFGPQGTLWVESGTVSARHEFGPWNEKFPVMSVQEFRRTVAHAVRQRR